MSNQQTIDQVYSDVEKLLSNETPTAVTLLPLVVHAMEFVEKYKGFTGEEKRALVIRLIHDRNPELASKELLGSFVDTVVAASKGLTRLNVTNRFGFVKKLFSCCN